MKVSLIINPTAKSGRGKRLWDEIFRELDRHEVVYQKDMSEYPGHAELLAYERAKSGEFDAVVAVGGDGTINEVLQGVCKAKEDKCNTPSFGILYTGTSPDICKFHGIPLAMSDAVRLIAENSTKFTDIGEVEHDGKVAWFLCSVNLGMGAKIASASNSGLRKYLGDFIGTLVSMLKAVFTSTLSDFKCEIDGSKETLTRCLNITIGKNPLIASGIKIDEDITPDDGRMYLFSVQNMGPFSMMRYIPSIYLGTFHKNRKNGFRFLKEFECLKNEVAPDVEYDGDPKGMLPCKIRLRERYLRIIK